MLTIIRNCDIILSYHSIEGVGNKRGDEYDGSKSSNG